LAQVIKNRRGPIGNLKNATANNAEVIVASGSISDLSGPFVFIGSPNPTDNGSSGAFKSVSKLYSGTNAPTISSLTYGTTLDGTPFYSTDSQSLYILNNDGVGNTELDLTGNIEGNTISNVTINTLGGDVEVSGDITGSNLQLSGDANIDGNITLGGNITIGDASIDTIDFNGVISSSLIPSESGVFDLGSPTNKWDNLYVENLEIDAPNFAGDVVISGSLNVSQSVQLQDTLDVDGQSTLASVTVEDLTDGRVVLAGTNGELEDSANLTFDGTTLTTTGIISGSGGLNIDAQSSIASLKVEDLTNNRLVVVGTDGELEDDSRLTFNGTVLNVDADITSSGDLEIDGQGSIASLAVEDLTDNRIVFAGVNGELEDDSNLRFESSTFKVGDTNFNVDATNGNTTIAGTLNVGANTILESHVFISGNLTLLGDATELIVSSSTVELDDNIIRLNAYSPFERYAGFEVIDSGSVGVSASLQWDSLNDYWLIQSSSQESGKVISTTYGTFGSEASLTDNAIPKATAENSIGDSLLSDSGTTLTYDTDAISVAATSGDTSIKGVVSLTNSGGTDATGNTSGIMFRNSSNQVGFVSTTETTDVLDGILGYKASDGSLVFSTVIDGGTF
jgi:cytoskeletal protein CcmA (bactofilin family)